MVQEYDRLRASQPQRRRAARVKSDRWRCDNPERYRAQNALNNGLRDGKIEKAPCEVCGGKRFNEATLRVRYKGRNIAEVLEMSIREAKEHMVRAGLPMRLDP